MCSVAELMGPQDPRRAEELGQRTSQSPGAGRDGPGPGTGEALSWHLGGPFSCPHWHGQRGLASDTAVTPRVGEVHRGGQKAMTPALVSLTWVPSPPKSFFTPKRHPAGSGLAWQTYAGAGVRKGNTPASHALSPPTRKLRHVLPDPSMPGSWYGCWASGLPGPRPWCRRVPASDIWPWKPGLEITGAEHIVPLPPSG